MYQGGYVSKKILLSLVFTFVIVSLFSLSYIEIAKTLDLPLQQEVKKNTYKQLQLKKDSLGEKLKTYTHALSEIQLHADSFYKSSFSGFLHFERVNKTWQRKRLQQKLKLQEDWSASYVNSLAEKLPLNSVSQGDVFWKRLKSLNGQAYWSMSAATSVNTILVGILKKDALAFLTIANKVKNAETLIVDTQNYALSYSQIGYSAESFNDHPFIKKYVNTEKIFASGEFVQNKSTNYFGSYEKLANTNLNLIFLSEVPSLSAYYAPLIYKIGLIFVVTLFFVLVGIFYFPLNKEKQDVDHIVSDLNQSIVELEARYQRQVEINSQAKKEVTEISESKIKESEEKLEAVAEQSEAAKDLLLKEFMNKQDKFLRKIGDGISHSLQTPVSAILGNAKIVRTRFEGQIHSQHDEFENNMFSIEKEARRIKSLLNNLERYSSIQNPREYNNEINMSEFIDGLIVEHKMKLEMEGIYIHKDMQSDLLVKASPVLLKHIFENLIENCIDALEVKSDKHIYFIYSNLVSGARLIIRDTGKGISPTDLKNVFDPFYTTKDFDDHDGLGLSYCLKASQVMNMKLKISSQENIGTDLIFEFENTSDNMVSTCENSIDSTGKKTDRKTDKKDETIIEL